MTSRAFVSALFPFKPTVKLMSSVLYDEGGVATPLLHLLALAVHTGSQPTGA